jgi:hypothetical protein
MAFSFVIGCVLDKPPYDTRLYAGWSCLKAAVLCAQQIAAIPMRAPNCDKFETETRSDDGADKIVVDQETASRKRTKDMACGDVGK